VRALWISRLKRLQSLWRPVISCRQLSVCFVYLHETHLLYGATILKKVPVEEETNTDFTATRGKMESKSENGN